MGTGGGGGTSAPPPPGLGQGGPFPFPQAKTSGACTIATSASAAAATMNAYNSWKSMFVTSTGAGNGLRVQSPQNLNGTTNGTVSEGMGYGMISAVYMNDRTTFDGLLTYAKAHFDNNGLMNWKITSGGTTASDGTGSALDGDEDMAWALLMASDQWSSTAYLDDARAMIDAIYGTTIAGDGTLKPGDQWGGTTMFYPDYFSPAYYRVFARATNNMAWSGIILDRGYTLMASVAGPSNGLVPNSSDTGNLSATNGTYGYNACRWPWRVAMDYCFNGETRAKTYLDKMGPFFNGIGGGNVGDGYNVTTGAQTSGNHNMAFIGPAGVVGMAGWQSLLDAAFAFGANGAGDNAYFTNSLRVVMMLMMSGNLLDYAHQ
jgi:endo-1,4-beta-D-glucanase Y